MWWHTSWTISFIRLFAALKSSGLVLFNKRDSVYTNRTGQSWERKRKRKKSFVEHQSLNDFDRGLILKKCYGSRTVSMNQTKGWYHVFPFWKNIQNTSSLSLHTLDFSSSSKMALDALGGGGGGGLSLGRTGSCKTIPTRAEGNMLAFYYTSFHLIDYIHFIYLHCIHACVQMLRQLWHNTKENRPCESGYNPKPPPIPPKKKVQWNTSVKTHEVNATSQMSACLNVDNNATC